MTASADVLKMIKDKDVKFVDLRFTDTKGKMQHVTADASCIDEAVFTDGYAFDGSSIAGWKGIDASDMTLMLDADSAHLDPFFAQTHAGDLLRRARAVDRRSLRARPARHRQEGRGLHEVDRRRRHGLFRPRSRVLHLRRRRFTSDPHHVSFKLDSSELPSNTDTDYEMGNLGHRPRTKGGYFPVPPIDSCPGHSLRDAVGDVRDGRRRREASPRSRRRPARARRQVRADAEARRRHADLQVCLP